MSDDLVVVFDKLAVAPGVGPRSPGAGRGLPVCGSHQGAVPARRRLAHRDRCAPDSQRGVRRRRPANRVRRHDRVEVYLFLEQRAPAGAEENEVTFAFQAPRTGMGAWLADAGSGGAAEYLPADALLAGYVSTREPLQLFEEFTALITKSEPDFERGLATMDEKLGAGFIQNLTAALGTESALALTGLLGQRPDVGHGERGEQPAGHRQLPPEAGGSVQRGAWAGRTGQTDRVRPGERGRTDMEHDEAGWTSAQHHLDIRSGLHGSGLGLRRRRACDCDQERRLPARLVAGIPRPASLVCRTPPIRLRLVEREGGARNPVGVGPEPGARRATAGRAHPILVVFDGTPERIHAASRTCISGLIMDVMLLESLGRATLGDSTERPFFR